MSAYRVGICLKVMRGAFLEDHDRPSIRARLALESCGDGALPLRVSAETAPETTSRSGRAVACLSRC